MTHLLDMQLRSNVFYLLSQSDPIHIDTSQVSTFCWVVLLFPSFCWYYSLQQSRCKCNLSVVMVKYGPIRSTCTYMYTHITRPILSWIIITWWKRGRKWMHLRFCLIPITYIIIPTNRTVLLQKCSQVWHFCNDNGANWSFEIPVRLLHLKQFDF